MIIRILPTQIPIFWEAIKFAQNKVNGTDEQTFNNLLYKLLNSKTQCFVRLDDNRQLMCLYLTEIYTNHDSGEKSIALDLIYGFQVMSQEVWENNEAAIIKFGKSEKCTKFYGMIKTDNKMMMQIAKRFGFKELETRMYKDI